MRHLLATAIAGSIFISTAAMAQTTLAGDSLNGGTTLDTVGQSFTVSGSAGQMFDHINFAFLYNGVDQASGNLYIFSSAYSGREDALSSFSTPGGTFLGSAQAANNMYQFSSLSLAAGTTYYAYTDQAFLTSTDTTNSYAGGQFYRSIRGENSFNAEPQFDNNFRVSGTLTAGTMPAVPEPASWAMMIIGFGLIGATLRSRKTKVAFA